MCYKLLIPSQLKTVYKVGGGHWEILISAVSSKSHQLPTRKGGDNAFNSLA